MGRGQSPHLAPCGTSKQGSWEDAIWGCGGTQRDTERGWAGSPTQDLFKNLSQDHPHRTVGEQNVLEGRRATEALGDQNSFRGLETNRSPGPGRPPLSTRCWCAACAVLHSGTPPLHSPLSSSRTEPNQTPRRSALSVVEQCHERQQRLARVPQPRVSCDGSQLASRPASRAHSHLAASSLTTPAAHCLRHLRSRHHAAAPVLLPLPQPSASRFRHPLTEAVR